VEEVRQSPAADTLRPFLKSDPVDVYFAKDSVRRGGDRVPERP
jgi:hypothetical protein